MKSSRYEEPQPISRKEIEAARFSKEGEVVASALIRMAFHENDWKWAETICLSTLSDVRKQVRLASLIALGHLARRHHTLHLETVIPAIRKLLDDADCRGVAEDTLEDIMIFVRETGSQSV
jgi:hypothetical protein